MFIICKQLNGPVLKSLKPRCLGRNWKKKLAGSGQNSVLRFGSGRAGLGSKFQFSFRDVPGSDINFNFSFGPGRARAEIFFTEIEAMRAGPGRTRSEKSGPCRPLVCFTET